MKALKIETTLLLIVVLFLSGCNAVTVSKATSLPMETPQNPVPKKALSEIDLTAIKHTAPVGRVQDDGVEGENFKKLSIIDDLIANGKDAIPFLISKLDNETVMDNQAMDYWYEVHVGDMALVILNNLFINKAGVNSTVKGFGWDDFLERGNDKASMSEAILRRYIKKHGRKTIKARWQAMWDANKDKIYWDETERCFNIKN